MRHQSEVPDPLPTFVNSVTEGLYVSLNICIARSLALSMFTVAVKFSPSETSVGFFTKRVFRKSIYDLKA